MAQLKKLEKAVDIVTSSYEKLWADVSTGKLSLADIVKKHKDGFVETTNKAYELSKLPDVDIIVEINEEGSVVRVLTATVKATAIVRYTHLAFDPHDTFDSETFADLKEYVEEVEEEAQEAEES